MLRLAKSDHCRSKQRFTVQGLGDFIVFMQFILCVDLMRVVESDVQDVTAA